MPTGVFSEVFLRIAPLLGIAIGFTIMWAVIEIRRPDPRVTERSANIRSCERVQILRVKYGEKPINCEKIIDAYISRRNIR